MSEMEIMVVMQMLNVSIEKEITTAHVLLAIAVLSTNYLIYDMLSKR